MTLVIFAAFMVVYAALAVSHRECDPRASKLFLFGFLISLLYASVYYARPDTLLLFILLLTSLAVLTQYLHWRAVKAGRAKPMKNVVDITTEPEEVLLKGKAVTKSETSKAARRQKSRHGKARRSKK